MLYVGIIKLGLGQRKPARGRGGEGRGRSGRKCGVQGAGSCRDEGGLREQGLELLAGVGEGASSQRMPPASCAAWQAQHTTPAPRAAPKRCLPDPQALCHALGGLEVKLVCVKVLRLPEQSILAGGSDRLQQGPAGRRRGSTTCCARAALPCTGQACAPTGACPASWLLSPIMQPAGVHTRLNEAAQASHAAAPASGIYGLEGRQVLGERVPGCVGLRLHIAGDHQHAITSPSAEAAPAATAHSAQPAQCRQADAVRQSAEPSMHQLFARSCQLSATQLHACMHLPAKSDAAPIIQVPCPAIGGLC